MRVLKVETRTLLTVLLSLNNAFDFLEILQRATSDVKITSLNPRSSLAQLPSLVTTRKTLLNEMDVKKRSSVASYCANISPRPFYHTHNIFPSGYTNPEWCQSPKCYAMRGKVIFPQLLSSIHMVSDKYTQIRV